MGKCEAVKEMTYLLLLFKTWLLRKKIECRGCRGGTRFATWQHIQK